VGKKRESAKSPEQTVDPLVQKPKKKQKVEEVAKKAPEVVKKAPETKF